MQANKKRNWQGLALSGIAVITLLVLGLSVGLPQITGSLPTESAAANSSDDTGKLLMRQPPLYATKVEVPAQYRDLYQGPTAVNLPAGFSIKVYASGFAAARHITVGACGDIYAGTTGSSVYRLPDRNHDGVADSTNVFASGLSSPAASVEYWNGQYFIGATNGVFRYNQANCDAAGSNQTQLVSTASGGNHATRTVLHSPDGQYFFLSMGSTCNYCIETDPMRAAIMRYNNDGSGMQVYATGLRNDVGLAFRPGTQELWSVENGVDNLGDDLPWEEVNVISQPGRYYGWPWCYGDGIQDTRVPNIPRPDYCTNGMVKPRVKMQAHSAPLELMFSTDSPLAFPAMWKQGIFVTFHGSWNRSIPTGYKLVYVPIANGGANGNPPTIDFATNGTSWRPVGLTVGPDNSLYMSVDSGGGTIYRITYNGN